MVPIKKSQHFELQSRRVERLREDFARAHYQQKLREQQTAHVEETNFFLGCLSKLLLAVLTLIGVTVCAIVIVIVPLRMLFHF